MFKDPNFLEEISSLIAGNHANPHSLLGIHSVGKDHKVIRMFRPQAHWMHVQIEGKAQEAAKVHDAGVFEIVVPNTFSLHDYFVYHHDGSVGKDPYAFLPTFTVLDEYLFGKGCHYELYNKMGAQVIEHQGVWGTAFTVWAPSAKQVCLVGDFNHWSEAATPMRRLGASGVWEIFIPGLQAGCHYKFFIKSETGEMKFKSDPYARRFEMRPKTASIVDNSDSYLWKDQEWMEKRKNALHGPINCYEVHLGSWQRDHGNHFLSFQKLAERLIPYCKHMGYTHLELLPIMEHPLDESWGYQVTGYYAVTSRYGTPAEFKAFVDECHKNGIGVILDWVPAHFPTDDFALARFDGTCLYEHLDTRKGFHPHWNTLIYNYGRAEVSNFLIANALFWLKEMHVDGLRVDAVASMLYLDYGRDAGAWIPNQYGGKENLEAIEFLKHLNSIVHEKCPGTLMIAEESTSFAGVTKSVSEGGLGFDLKWNMGWMNDTLRYFSTDPLYRNHHQNKLTFGLLYAFSEKFISVLSHDEVVHGKRSLISKMPGDVWQKFANLRLLYSYLITQPGKKLIFMGAELAQWSEWYSQEPLPWHLLDQPMHKGIQEMFRSLNHLYLKYPQLWADDFNYTGFEWVDFRDVQNGVLAYKRKAPYVEGKPYRELLSVHHFTPTYHENYLLNIKRVKSCQEIFNSDDAQFGGSGKVNPHIELFDDGIKIAMPPLATVIFEIEYV